jgi:hypothetical protein
MADVVGPTRRILAPPANERWRRRLPQTHYELESHDAPIRESAQDLHATPPAPMRGTTTRQSHDHAGQRGSATHNAKKPDRDTSIPSNKALGRYDNYQSPGQLHQWVASPRGPPPRLR